MKEFIFYAFILLLPIKSFYFWSLFNTKFEKNWIFTAVWALFILLDGGGGGK